MTIVYSQYLNGLANGAAIPNWANQGSSNFQASNVNPVFNGIGARDVNAANGDIAIVSGFTAIANQELRFDATIENTNNGSYLSSMGAFLRSDATGANGYCIILSGSSVGSTLVAIGFKFVSGSPASLGGGISITGMTYSSGQVVSCRFRISGSTISVKIWPYNTAEPSGFNGTWTDSSITAAGYFGWYQANGAGGVVGSTSIGNITLNNLTAGFNANLTTVYTSLGRYVEIILTGTGTSWSGSPFSMSGGSGAGIFVQTVISNTLAVLYIQPGTAAGTLTISDGTYTVPITVLAGTTYAPSDQDVRLFGPQNINTQIAETITSGLGGEAYFSGNSCLLRFNVYNDVVCPDIIYQVDRDPPVRQSLSQAFPCVTITPVYQNSGVPYAYQHTVRWWYSIFEGVGAPQPNINQWYSQLGAAVLGGIDCPGSGALMALPPRNPNVLMCVGDSLTQSIRTFYNSTYGVSDQTMELPISDWCQQLADYLGFDLLQLGYGGTGVTVSGSGSVPAAPNSLGYCYASTNFNPTVIPSVAICYEGTNDSAASSGAFQAGYVSTLNAMRTLAPNCIIFAVNPHPCNGTFIASRAADIQAAITTSGLSNVFFADAGANANIIYPISGVPVDTADTIGHLNPGGHAKLFQWFAGVIQTKFNALGIKQQAGGGSSSFGFA